MYLQIMFEVTEKNHCTQLFLANIIISGTIKCAVMKHTSCYSGDLNNPCANTKCEYIIFNLLIIYLKIC